MSRTNSGTNTCLSQGCVDKDLMSPVVTIFTPNQELSSISDQFLGYSICLGKLFGLILGWVSPIVLDHYLTDSKR